MSDWSRSDERMYQEWLAWGPYADDHARTEKLRDSVDRLAAERNRLHVEVACLRRRCAVLTAMLCISLVSGIAIGWIGAELLIAAEIRRAAGGLR
jgi:hypothetical protein